MKPMDPYLAKAIEQPHFDVRLYECNSVADYLRNKDNDAFERGTRGILAFIHGPYILQIIPQQSSSLTKGIDEFMDEVKKEPSMQSIDGIEALKHSLKPQDGIDAYLKDEPSTGGETATVFIHADMYKLFSFPDPGENMRIRNPRIWYPPELKGTRLQGMYFGHDRDNKRGRKQPIKPKTNPERVLEPV